MQKRLIKPQKIAMLEYLGVPFRQQPKPSAEKDYLLDKYRKLDETKYKEAYSVIMLHRIPDHLVNDAEAVSAHKIGELVEGVFDGEKSKISLQAAETTKKAVADVTATFSEATTAINKAVQERAFDAIAEATKKFITHRVQVGNKPAKTIQGVVPEYFDTMLELAQQRKNILLVGPAGSGKTHTAELLATALDLPFSSQSCTAGVSESVFTGWLLPTGDNGKFTHVASSFLTAYENGGVFLLDEIDRSDPNVMVFLNQALANNKFFLPQRFDKPEVVKHPDFIAVAAGNTWGGGADTIYHSANALDGSTLDRFRMGTIDVDYSETVEQNLVDSQILEWGLGVRAIIRKNGFRRIMSTRVLIDATDMKRSQDWSMEKIQDTYFGDWSVEEKLIYKRDRSYS